MGQKQNQTDIEYGNDCLLKFEAGKTPKHMYARFSKIVTCPEAPTQAPNDRVFKLTQDPEFPCWWHYGFGDPWLISLQYIEFPPRSQLDIIYGLFDFFFYSSIDGYVDEGQIFFSSQDLCAGATKGIYGIGIITWRLETLKLMGLLNIEVADDLLMEMHPLEDGSRVYKYCKLKDATNIAIKYSPD